MTTRPLWRAAALSALSALWISCSDTPAGAPTGDANAELASLAKRIRGAVVYQRPDGIYKTAIGEKTPVRLAKDGTYPRWSPDGRHVAFVRGKQIMRVAADGSREDVLAGADDPRAVGYHPNGKEVLFTDGREIRAVDVKNRQVRTVVKGHVFRELDITEDGRRLVATIRRMGYTIIAYDLESGKDWRIASGCSASLSPDGRLVTNNGSGHTEMYLRSWKDGKKKQTLPAPPGRKFDNQKWSNRQDWIVSKSEGKEENVFIHQVSSERAAQVTFSGDCDRPDLYISKEL